MKHLFQYDYNGVILEGKNEIVNIIDNVVSIKLTQDKISYYDFDDFELLSKHRWYAQERKRTYYARTNIWKGNGVKTSVGMHIMILGRKKGYEIDHKKDDSEYYGLDNRRENLQFLTPRENHMKCRPKKGKLKGVFFVERTKNYRAKIRYMHKQEHLGNFNTAVKAAKAYDKRAFEISPEYAYLNFKIDLL